MKTQHVTLCLDSIIPETLIDGGRTLHDGTHRNLNGWNSNGTHIQTDNQSIKMGGVKNSRQWKQSHVPILLQHSHSGQRDNSAFLPWFSNFI